MLTIFNILFSTAYLMRLLLLFLLPLYVACTLPLLATTSWSVKCIYKPKLVYIPQMSNIHMSASLQSSTVYSLQCVYVYVSSSR